MSNMDKLAVTPSAITFSPLVAGLIVVAFVLGLGVGYLAWGMTASAPTDDAIAAAVQETLVAQSAARAAQAEAPQNVKRYDVPVDDDYILGPEDAPITLIEFSDFQCPYCSKWYAETFSQLLETYPGQIRFVYRDFPLTSIHPEALPAAEAANCAGEQGKYYEYHNSLFSNKYQLGSESYPQYASELSLDTNKFEECLNSDRQKQEVMDDLQWASELGIQSTPTFFINGIPLVGAQPFESFQQVIDLELAGKISK
jgi:protein-disulfide isomerase